jgi:hypothetical protein
MSVLRLLLFGIAAFSFVGCSSSYLVKEPHVLQPCYTENARELSTAAVIKSFNAKRWTVLGVNPEDGFVRAEACRGSYCISVDSKTNTAGQIEILRTPNQYLSNKGGRLLEKWIRNLDKAYSRYYCTEPRLLLEEFEDLSYPPIIQ